MYRWFVTQVATLELGILILIAIVIVVIGLGIAVWALGQRISPP